MPRSRSARGLLLPAILVAGAVAPAPASAVYDEYRRLSERDLPRAPLVPTRAPAELRPIERTLSLGSTRRRSAYAIRLVREPDTVIALEGGDYASMREARRDLVRRQGFRARATRIRGQAGLALTRRSPRQHGLVWREGGVVYWIGTGTPRTISPAELRDTANGLDRLEHAWSGSGGNPDLPTSASLVTTRRTVSGLVDWGASCTNPDGSAATQYAGSVQVNLLPRSGDRFAFDLAGRDTGSLRWNGQVSGTVGTDAVTMTVRATGTFDGASCDTGPLELRLTRPG